MVNELYPYCYEVKISSFGVNYFLSFFLLKLCHFENVFFFLKNVFLFPLLLWLFYLSLIWQVQMYNKNQAKEKVSSFLILVLLNPIFSVS